MAMKAKRGGTDLKYRTLAEKKPYFPGSRNKQFLGKMSCWKDNQVRFLTLPVRKLKSFQAFL